MLQIIRKVVLMFFISQNFSPTLDESLETTSLLHQEEDYIKSTIKKLAAQINDYNN